MYWGPESQLSNRIAPSENKLNWNQHCDLICYEQGQWDYGPRKKSPGWLHYRCEIESLTFVRPQLEYASSAWYPHTKHSINRIEMVQRVTPMINQLGWDTLEQRGLLSQLTMLYKIQQGVMGIPLPHETFPLNRENWL